MVKIFFTPSSKCKRYVCVLELSEIFSKWWERMIGYGFTDNVDYTPYQKVHPPK